MFFTTSGEYSWLEKFSQSFLFIIVGYKIPKPIFCIIECKKTAFVCWGSGTLHPVRLETRKGDNTNISSNLILELEINDYKQYQLIELN